MVHRSGRKRSGPPRKGIEGLKGVVSAEVLHALAVADAQLTKLGIPHVIVGGLAVGYHGHPRATKDVDFLVGDDAFEHHAGGLVTMRAGVPIEVAGVPVDLVSLSDEDRSELEVETDGFAEDGFISLAGLIFMKLRAGRRQDKADIAALVEDLDDGEVEELLEDLDLQDDELRAELDEILAARND